MSEVNVSPVVRKAARTLANRRMVTMTPAQRKEVALLGAASRFGKAAEKNRLAELERKMELSKERLIESLK